MDRLVSYDDASVIAEIQRVAATMPNGPITKRAFDAVARVSSSTVVARFGGWENALVCAGLEGRYGGRRVSVKMREQRGRSASQDDIVAELRSVAEKVGSTTVTMEDLARFGEHFSPRVVTSRFGTWRAALQAAGLELSERGYRWTDNDYFDNLLDVWTHYGRPPTYAEMGKPPSHISAGGYEKRFGSWGRAKTAFVERVNSDLALGEEETTPAPRVPTPPRPRQEDQRTIPVGLRYRVLLRDSFKCVLCGRAPATDPTTVLHVDHVLAFTRGGKTRIDNLRTLCRDCNLGKRAGD